MDLGQSDFITASTEQAACNQAASLVPEGKAQVLMKGQVQTSSFIRAILNKQYGLIPPRNIISCVSCFELPGYPKLLFMTDPAVNIAPSLEVKVCILQNAIAVARHTGIARPRVACIEPIETVNPKIPSTIDAQELKKMGEVGEFGPALVDGPFGFDVAMAQKAARIKGIKSQVAGRPDILMMPQLVSANVLYKSFVWNGQAQVASIVTGARAPIVLTSRSDSGLTRLYSIGLAVFLAAGPGIKP
jgi:phosphate butyryltransferase